MASGRCNQGAGAQAMPLRVGTGAKGPKGWACEEVTKAEGFGKKIPLHFMSPTPVTVRLRGAGWGQQSGSGWREGSPFPPSPLGSSPLFQQGAADLGSGRLGGIPAPPLTSCVTINDFISDFQFLCLQDGDRPLHFVVCH